jgi:hypothetical protein
VDPAHFEYRERDGKIKMAGWAGGGYLDFKQKNWGESIAKSTQLEFKTAENLEFEQMKDWYQSIDVLLITTVPNDWQETGPLTAYEAIVSGALVIGTPVGNFRKIPGPKFSTVEQGIQIVEDLKKHPEKVKKIAKEQYECVMNNWTYEKLAHYWRSAFYATMR